ncbi:hypothetical protein BGZ76_005644 [Entomortierella beljakovae]|nr:hypothetical protein BGZ76_005644 [Entomortierella beljakovae]
MSKALDPLRRLVVQFNARMAHFKAFPAANKPPSAPPHVHATPPSAAVHSVPFPTQTSVFGQFQVKVPYPSHKDGPILLAHLNKHLNTFARNFFVPEPARVAAVDYGCRSAGRTHITSLLTQGSHGMLHRQPLRFAVPHGFTVPHGFAKNVGFFSARGFSSTVGTFPALNGPVNMVAQMYAKPLGSLPAKAKILSDKERSHHQLVAKKRLNKRTENDVKKRNKAHRGGEIKKRPFVACIPAATVQAFLGRAAIVEQQHQIMTICNANVPITTATAISLAKVAGKSMTELKGLPKLNTSDDCPTNVDMSFILDASPLWHLDTMVSALHTDSLRAPKELNSDFIEDLLEITNAQYQHFLEVSAILQRLVKCPEVREITLEGYELRVHFVGTTLFDMIRFLMELSIDPKSPHFSLEEVYVDQSMTQNQYFPQASINGYYEESLTGNDAWDDCESLHSLMYTESERCSSVASFATLDSLAEQDCPWEGFAAAENASITVSDEASEQGLHLDHADYDLIQEDHDEVTVSIIDGAPVDTIVDTSELFLGEEPASPWKNSTENLNMMSSKILNSAVVSEEYFDNIRGFLDSIEAVHRHSEKLFGSSTQF